MTVSAQPRPMGIACLADRGRAAWGDGSEPEATIPYRKPLFMASGPALLFLEAQTSQSSNARKEAFETSAASPRI
jgi:hypothetical protein